MPAMLPELRGLRSVLRAHRAELALATASFAAVAGVLLALELGARLVGPGPLPAEESVDGIYDGHVYSELLGWEPRPGARFTVAGAPTTIDAFGLRGQAPPRNPRAGRTRVLLLGDSVAFGYGVADDQTFAHLLDPDGARFETVNLAVPGYGVDQSLRRYELTGRAWRPQVVVLNLCVDNDLADIMLPVFLYDGQHPKPYFSLRAGQLELHDAHLELRWTTRLGLWLSERSHLYRRLAWRRAPAGAAAGEEHWTHRRRLALQDGAAAEDLMAALLARLRSEVERDNARLVLAVHPSKSSYRGRDRWAERVTQRPALAGLQIVSLGQAYRDAGLGFGGMALDGIGHLSPLGHRLAAEALRRELERWPGPAPTQAEAR